MNEDRKQLNVFLGWSGELSLKVANILHEWLKDVLPPIKPFISTRDIEGGGWFNELCRQFQKSNYSILCITEENVNMPWINFEAGALLARKIIVAPFLFGIDRNRIIKSPLFHLQWKTFCKNDFHDLVFNINATTKPPWVDPTKLTAKYRHFWPILEKKLTPLIPLRRSFPIGGDNPFHGFGDQINPARLDGFHQSAREKLDILGHSLAGLWETGGRKSILTALKNGATVRIVFLDPTKIHLDQISQINNRIKEDLRIKIEKSLKRAIEFKRDIRGEFESFFPNIEIKDGFVDGATERLQIAASELIFYAHIQRADRIMLVSQYSQAKEPGRNAPTTEIPENDDLFSFYEKEFSRIWADSTPIEEISSNYGIQNDRSRILAHLPEIRKIHDSIFMNNNATNPLPFPRMLVVLPNMACTIKCPHCFTRNSMMMMGGDMKLELMRSIVRQAGEMDSKSIELSGGGEPLDHPEAESLLRIVSGQLDGKIQKGILTNGSAILTNSRLAEEVVKFDYVRISFSENLDSCGIDSREEEKVFETLQIIEKTRRAQESNVRIGVKLLLTKNNEELIMNRIHKLLESKPPIVTHIKIKSIRGEEVMPSSDQIRQMEHKLALIKSKYGGMTRDLQIDLKPTFVPLSYRCWINPIMAVIDAQGEVYQCINFYQRPGDLRIGSLGNTGKISFKEFWGGELHRNSISSTDTEAVCNSLWGCHCRLVNYQTLVTPLLPTSHKLITPMYFLSPSPPL